MSSMYALLDKQPLSFPLLSFPSSSRHPFGFLPGFLCVVAVVFLLRAKLRGGVPESWKGCVLLWWGRPWTKGHIQVLSTSSVSSSPQNLLLKSRERSQPDTILEAGKFCTQPLSSA